MTTHERTWVRNHRSSGFIAGQFDGEFDGQPRQMLVLQTLKGTVIVPAGSVIPITKEDMIRQAALDLEPIIESLVEGGFDLDDVAAAWQRALTHKHQIAERVRDTSDPSAANTA